MVFLGIGFGIAFVLEIVFGGGYLRGPAGVFGATGAIVGLLGLGNLVYYFVARDQKPATPS